MKLSKMLSEIAGLSRDQHGLLRDAGWERGAAAALNTYTYQSVRSEAEYGTSKEPAKPKQLAFLKARDFDIDLPDATYEMLRAVIRAIAKSEGDDALYLEYIARAENKSRERDERRKRAKARSQQSTSKDTTSDANGSLLISNATTSGSSTEAGEDVPYPGVNFSDVAGSYMERAAKRRREREGLFYGSGH